MRLLVLHHRQLISQSIASHTTIRGYQTLISPLSLADAKAIAQTFVPDIAIVDVEFDSGNGFRAAHLLMQLNSKLRVILVLPPKADFLQPALMTDASGYLPTDFDLPELDICLQQLEDRFRYISPTFASRLSFPLPTTDPAVIDKLDGLTKRHKQVLILVCRGLMITEIADILHLSFDTIVSHKKTIAYRLGLKSRRDLVYFMIPYGEWLQTNAHLVS